MIISNKFAELVTRLLLCLKEMRKREFDGLFEQYVDIFEQLSRQR